jgi:ferritin-like metal-binding protein YciE
MPEGLKELYIDQLKDLFSAETRLVRALLKLAKASWSEQLRQGFEKHLEQTKGTRNLWKRFCGDWAQTLRARSTEAWRV